MQTTQSTGNVPFRHHWQ